ncbi:hypothetical protein OQA88_4446 [Cercophora sp. LCS_1]
MRFTSLISALCLLLPTACLAAPSFGGVSEDGSAVVNNTTFGGVSERAAAPVDRDTIQDRAVPILATLALGLVTEYADDAIKFLIDISNMNDKKEAWVTKTINTLSDDYPSLNIIIYSNPKGQFSFGGSDHYRLFDFELPIAAFGVKETYHILFTDNEGWFLRAGDGGYINWIFRAGTDFEAFREDKSPLVEFLGV